MERGLVVFGVLFLVLPALFALGMVVVPAAAFVLALLLVALLAIGFGLGIAFIDV